MRENTQILLPVYAGIMWQYSFFRPFSAFLFSISLKERAQVNLYTVQMNKIDDRQPHCGNCQNAAAQDVH
ncbi:MAG: hypothetical protein Q4G66_05455 [bacterium]|nr:hypothetical protein [bacterium]